MMKSFLAFGLAALVLVPVTTSAQAPSRPAASDARTRGVYVSVLDGKGATVPGLSAGDFSVREDGVAREVLKAEPATEPMQITVLIDDSQSAEDVIQPMREGLNRFVDKLKDHAEIGLVTVGERATSLVTPTTSTAALKTGINRIFARPGSGAYLLDAISDVSKGFEKRHATRPVIVAVTTEGAEFSNLLYQDVLKQLEASGAAFHVLAIGSPSSSMADEMRNRGMVLAEGPKATGGRRDQLLHPAGIAEALPRLADELLNEYLVTYGRPDTLIPPEKIQVSVSRPGVTARARTRVSGR
ncbi:MAG: VWA domain-containing protein [Acidobacteriota bacterium]